VVVLRVMRGMLFSGRGIVQPYRGADLDVKNPALAGSVSLNAILRSVE